MNSEEVNQTYLDRAAAMFSVVNGRPCVNVDAKTGEVYYCNRLDDLSTADDVLEGMCDWQASDDERPDELTDGVAIGSDLLDVGENWWLDMYFEWYFVFKPEFIERSSRGDHSWVPEFLHTITHNRTIPRPPPSDDMTHLLPEADALKYYG